MRLPKFLELLIGHLFFMSALGEGGGEAPPAEADDSGAADGEPAAGDPDLVNEGWLTGVQNEFANDPIMSNVKDVPTLVKNYVNAQRLVGKKGVMLPDENSGEDKWNEFYTQLGRPVDAAGYALKAPEGQEEVIQRFAEQAHKIGLVPRQAEAMLDFLRSTSEQESEAEIEARQAQEAQAIDALKSEWGEGFQTKLHKAQVVAKQFGGDNFIAELDAKGLGNDVGLIKFLANIGESLNEESFQSEAVSQFRMTPEEAQEKIDTLMASKDHPYWNPEHQDHYQAKKEMEKLFAIVS